MVDGGLSSYAGNITSQNGEDGILEEIFRRIGSRTRVCVEFGAWDGKYLSNTWSLWHNKGWSAVLIEGNPERYAALRDSVADYPAVSVINAYVTSEGGSSLESLLSRSGVPSKPDVLSVDIDGDEYHVWSALQRYRPRVVVIEYNPTIPPEMDIVQFTGEYFGASAKALVRLARAKSYRLACCTETNCIFVAEEDFAGLGFTEPELEKIFPRGNLTYVINAYDGRTYINRNPPYSPPIADLGVFTLERELRRNLLPRNTGSAASPVPPGSLKAVKVFGISGIEPRGLLRRLYPGCRRALAQTPAGALYRALSIRWKGWLADRKLLAAWRAAGRPAPPPHQIKQRVIRRYASRYRLRVLVETGTYLGEMVAAMHRRFDRVVSIELDETLHRQACERFAHLPRVRIVRGDSGVVLPQILAEVDQPALFWLDGHYSAGITAKAERETPILKELQHILNHAVDRHVILIDDARCFDGTHDYPTLEELRQYVRTRRPHSTVEVEEDIVRIIC